MSFDAWGKRRNPDWSEGPQLNDPNDPNSGIQPGTDHTTTIRAHLTYTGQESLTEVGLIHMNGRVYDPELGKFLSADPHVQFEANLQSYNRYAYVHNNPLKYADTTGYFLSLRMKSMSP
jgi:RHS repeat-associated protein